MSPINNFLLEEILLPHVSFLKLSKFVSNHKCCQSIRYLVDKKQGSRNSFRNN